MLIHCAQADNQTSSRLFRDAEPKVRLPAASVRPLTVKVYPSSAVSAPTTIPPHLRELPACSARYNVRSDLKRKDPFDHTQASEFGTAALTVETGEKSPPSADSCRGDDQSTPTLIKSIRHLLASIESSGPCLPSVVPKIVSALKEGHASIKDAQLQHTQSIARSSPPTTLQHTDNDCPICDGPYTHDEPGMSTPCCGLLIHQLCNFEALEEHGRCHGCHGDQTPADISEPGSPSETDEYIRHFEPKPQSFSPRSLKSEQVGASSTSSAVITLREYVESQASTRFGTSSIATDKSSASSSSWLSSVEDDEYEAEDSSPVVISEGEIEQPLRMSSQRLISSRPKLPRTSTATHTRARPGLESYHTTLLFRRPMPNPTIHCVQKFPPRSEYYSELAGWMEVLHMLCNWDGNLRHTCMLALSNPMIREAC